MDVISLEWLQSFPGVVCTTLFLVWLGVAFYFYFKFGLWIEGLIFGERIGE